MLLQSLLHHVRTAGRRWVALLALLACGVTACAAVEDDPPPESVQSSASTALEEASMAFTVQLGPEQRVYGPSGLTDFPYFSERTRTGRLVGFISNNDSYRVQTKSNRVIRNPRVALRRGKPGTFDKCGAWLIGSVYKKSPRRWIALYHAEAAGRGDNNRCIFNDDSVVASVGRAVSRNAGRTWRKTGQVVTQDDRLTSPKTEDATLGRMIRVRDHLYLFYGASVSSTNTSRRLMVARSPVSELGARGTWRKWHCTIGLLGQRRCGWSEPGLGGRSTPIEKLDPMARMLTPNTYLDHYIALAATGTKGFRLWVSNIAAGAVPVDPESRGDGTAWRGSVQIYPPVTHADDPQVDTWNRTRRAKQLYAYPSIVATNGSSNTSGRSFYIYYVKLFPGDDFPKRHLMRRKVTLTKDPSRLHRVALTTYFRKKDGRRRTSTEVPLEKAFRARSAEGFLLGNGELHDGWIDVFDCTRNGDHRLRTRGCGRGEHKYRRVGWISPDRTEDATVPIFRCYNRRKKNHFASTERGCEGFRREARLGFGLPSV